MNTILRWVFAACALLGAAEGLSAQAIIRSAATGSSGTAAPASGDCDAAAELGRLYVQAGDPASVVNQVWACMQTGAATFAWRPASIQTGTAAPATCTTGQVFFDTDATAGSNWFGCTAPDTWTAMGGGSGGTKSIDLQFTGFNNAGSDRGSFFAINNSGVLNHLLYLSGEVAASDLLMLHTGTPTISRYVYIPPDFASGLQIELFGVDSNGAASGNVRYNYTLGCPPTGAAFAGTATNTAQSPTIAVTGYTHLYIVTATALATSGCSAGQLAFLTIARDNAVGSNAAASQGIMHGRLIYTSSY